MSQEDKYKAYLLKCFDRIKKIRKVQIESNGQYARIQCFNPNHKGGLENTPSFRVNLVKNGKFRAGSGTCFSCGLYVSSFNKVLEAIARPDLLDYVPSDTDEDEFISVNKKTSLLLEEDDTVFQFADDSIPWPKHRTWRGINGELINNIGGKLYFDTEQETQMLYLPCFVHGSEVGFIRANLEKQGKLNYFNSKGSWTKTLGLFPYDYTEALLRKTCNRTLVLTEGVRDPLNSIQHDIPTLAILGTNNWSEVKAQLVLSLPINRLVLAFDPDEAGDKATKEVYKTLKNELSIRRFDFTPYGNGIDPAAMTPEVARKLRHLSQIDW